MLVGALLGLLADGLPACDRALFYFEGEHPSLDEPLCFCSVTGELCSHPGFGACIECPTDD